MNEIICGDCLEILLTLPEGSVDMIITSPPYNMQKSYEQLLSKPEYLDFSRKWIKECHRVLTEKGRMCINVPNNIRVGGNKEIWSPSISLGNILEEIGFKFFDYIIWNQGYSMNGTAWGSFVSCSAPFIRHQAEAVLVYYKNDWKLQKDSQSDITKLEFLDYTRSEIWKIQPVTNREAHEAPFPEELVYRLLKLFTYRNDVVIDPFCGSGTTPFVCKKLGRRYIGIDKSPEYCALTKSRLSSLTGSEQLLKFPQSTNLMDA